MSRLDANLKMRLDYEINMLERAKKEYSDRLYQLLGKDTPIFYK